MIFCDACMFFELTYVYVFVVFGICYIFFSCLKFTTRQKFSSFIAVNFVQMWSVFNNFGKIFCYISAKNY